MALSNLIEASLARLNAKKPELLTVSEDILKAYKGALYPLDLLAMATVNRTLHFIPAFVHCIESGNFFVAAPLLRMQLDSCLRLSAAWIVPNSQEYASQVLDGIEPRKLKDSKGRQLTDRHLVSMLAPKYPWVESVYKRCSGFVHLSRDHIVTMLTKKPGHTGDAGLAFEIGFGANAWDERQYIEAVEGFIASIDLLLVHLRGWYATKDKPHLFKRP